MNITERVKNAVRDIPDFPQPGILFKDITPLVLDADLSKAITAELVARARKLKPTAVCGIESRGFLFGVSMAQELGVPLILIRKKGKLPGKTIEVAYALEYGEAVIEMHAEDLPPGSRVLIHDDLLATGGTATAAAHLVEKAGSEVVGFSFLINLSFLPGEGKIRKVCEEVQAIVSY